MAEGQGRSFRPTPDLRSWNLGKGALGAWGEGWGPCELGADAGGPRTAPPPRKGTVKGQSWWFQQNTSTHVTSVVLTAFQTRSLHRGLCLSTLLLVFAGILLQKGVFSGERGPHAG